MSSKIEENNSAANLANTIDKKKKKRDEKNISQILSSISHLTTEEEKFQALARKCIEAQDETRRQKDLSTEAQKKLTNVTKEKDQIQLENNKLILAKDRLETLCRELQKMNKAVKEESDMKEKLTEEKRQSVSATFQTKVNEVQQQMNEYQERNNQLRAENDSLGEKLKEFVDQFTQRTEHMDKIIQAKTIEGQLAEAKMKQAELKMTELSTLHEAEKAKLINTIQDCHKQNKLMDEINGKLRDQTTFYKEKYDEFHQTVSQSTEIYNVCKKEMDKMSKKLKELDKAAMEWKKKYENSSHSVYELAKDKVNLESVIATQQTKLSSLEKLCRTLHSRLNDQKKSGDDESTLDNKSKDNSDPTDTLVKDNNVETLNENGDTDNDINKTQTEEECDNSKRIETNTEAVEQ